MSNAPTVPRTRTFIALIAAMATSGCFVRHRTVAAPGKPQNRDLITASKQDLVDRIHRVSDFIQSFNIRADMAPSVGQISGGELTDYATVRAYILFRKPDEIRVIGLDPVVHSKTIFDMISIGPQFKVYIPTKNTFYIGNNNAPPSSKNKLENLRPTAFLTSLIIPPPDPSEQTMLVDDTDESKAIYILFMLGESQGQRHIKRAVYFDRYTLHIVRQKTFDESGGIVSETRYSDWKNYDPILYPSTILMRRPKDGYELTMTLVSEKFNPQDLTDSQFALEQPQGVKVVEIR